MLRSFASGALFGVAHGDGAPWSLALHGWQRTHADFDRVLGDGAAGGAVASLAVDLPGFGASPPPPSPWGSDDYAQATLGILRSMVDELGGPIVVLGHSFGGRVGVRLAVAAPELVSALVLSGVPLLARAGGRRRAPVGLRLVKAARRAGLASEGRVEAARLRHGSTDYRRAEGVMRQTLVREVNERYEEDLARLACPVELVWGERDDVAPLDVAQRAAAMIARSRLSVCPGASHLLCLEEPQALREAIERHRP